jgi:hypothetical protein
MLPSERSPLSSGASSPSGNAITPPCTKPMSASSFFSRSMFSSEPAEARISSSMPARARIAA